MVGLVSERTGENFIIPLAFRKKEQAGTAEKDLIAGVQPHGEEDPSAGLV
jgi:hypothetical protein